MNVANGKGQSVANRLNALMRFSDVHPDYTTDSGELLADAIVEGAITLLPNPDSYVWTSDAQLPDDAQALLRALAVDGYAVVDGKLRRMLPEHIVATDTQNVLSALLAKHSFDETAGHLEQVLDNHTRGAWAAANSQMRTFLESMLDEIAIRLDMTNSAVASGHARRAKLAAMGFLDRDLGEWTDDGKGYINGLFRRLNPDGSHPGLSDEEDSTFRLHVILTTARLLMTRFDTRLRK